ncbi:MAG: AgmX/PglI C-terminal domain-containing protein [Oligoflexia bacterium]|nr:AgmX/PglI C-terminal domain-containing protein [Oligoflexia bacterium]
MQGAFVLENKLGQVVRTFHWKSQTLSLVYREDTRRIVPVKNTDDLDDEGIPYTLLTSSTKEQVQSSNGVKVGSVGYLRWVPTIESQVLSPTVKTKEDDSVEDFKKALKWTSLILLLLLSLTMVVGYFFGPELPEEEHIVMITPRTKRAVEPMTTQMETPKSIAQQKPKTPKVAAVKTSPKAQAPVNTVGALGVLGSLNKSNQKGGLQLNAVAVSRGAGLGGTAGSGGVQTSFYGKGLVGAALGPGAKAQGLGGYGTKGKGGGRAGYGQLSLIGSSSAVYAPIEKDATIEGGLTMEQIAAVINRHLGEVRYCYERGIQSNPDVSGRLAIRFFIAGTGIVKSANTTSSSLRDVEIENCIVERLKTWKFPEPKGGATVKVDFPFVLKRTSQG